MELMSRKYLAIGEVYIASKPIEVWTVLGSCVAITLYNKRLKISAICHAQLPDKGHSNTICSDSCTNPCFTNLPPDNLLKYVSCSLNYMVDELSKMGIKNREIETGLYGGSNIFGFKFTFRQKSIGEQNIDIARKMLSKYGLHISDENVGGSVGRKILFNSSSGKVQVKMQQQQIVK